MILKDQLGRGKVHDEYHILRPIETRQTDAHRYEKNVEIQ